MVDDPAQPASRGGGRQFAGIVRETLLVGVIGVGFAFLANQISPRGLNPARNYFPGGQTPVAAPSRSAAATNAPASASSPAVLLAARLQEKGLHLLERAGVEKLFHDPRREQNAVLFVDARDEEHYGAGHIPGAFEFYPYHPEKYLADVLAPCQFAEKIIVYCTGGECEDSESAALFLRDAGVPAGKLFVYGGGMTEWEAAGLPVETGARDSGDIHHPGP